MICTYQKYFIEFIRYDPSGAGAKRTHAPVVEAVAVDSNVTATLTD